MGYTIKSSGYGGTEYDYYSKGNRVFVVMLDSIGELGCDEYEIENNKDIVIKYTDDSPEYEWGGYYMKTGKLSPIEQNSLDRYAEETSGEWEGTEAWLSAKGWSLTEQEWVFPLNSSKIFKDLPNGKQVEVKGPMDDDSETPRGYLKATMNDPEIKKSFDTATQRGKDEIGKYIRSLAASPELQAKTPIEAVRSKVKSIEDTQLEESRQLNRLKQLTESILKR